MWSSERQQAVWCPVLFWDPGESSDYLKGRSLSLKAKIDFIQSFNSKYEPPRCKLKVETSHEIKQPQGAEILHRFGVTHVYSYNFFFPTDSVLEVH